MGVRASALTWVVVATVAVGVPVALTQTRAADAADKPSFKTPRTSWGDPDLQGVWDYRTITPLERRPEMGDRELYTDQEIAQLEGRAARRLDEAPDTSVQTNLVHADYLTDPGRHVDESRRNSLIVDPKNGRVPPLTPDAQQRQEKAAAARTAGGAAPGGRVDTYLNRPLYERCITRGIAGSSLRVVYGNGQRVVQGPGVVAISYEMVHDTRLIYTDGRPHINQAIRQYLGDSRAHWEGDELVVETTNLTDKTAIGVNGNGNRHSTQMKLTERYKRVAADILQYQTTVDDPVTYARPFTMSYPLTPLDGGRLLPYDCHEGNFALLQSLGGERAEDRALEADAKKGIVRPRRPVQGGLGVGGQPVGEGGFGAVPPL